MKLLSLAVALLAAVLPVDAQTVDQSGLTATWSFNEGASSSTTATASTDGLFSVASLTLGSGLSFNGVQTVGSLSESKIQPADNYGTDTDVNAITLTLIPKKGLTFSPTNVAFCVSRIGTNGGVFDVVASSGSNSVSVATDQAPYRNNASPAYTEFSQAISGLSVGSSGMTIKIYIRGLANTKDMGFCNFVVTGDMSGSIVAVQSFSLSASVASDGAGSVAVSPAASAFDEGTQVTVTASENFGYHFAAWTDDAGNQVSTENPYVFSINANTSLVATYTKNNVYALNMAYTDGVRANLISVEPTGNVVDGVHYFEEGTDVMLTALNNKIFTFTNWEDNSTSASRTLHMSSDTSVEATFAANDYIVGWDFYNDSPASQRAADYASDSENAGLLSLRDESGATTSWLALGYSKGGQNGKYGARIWKVFSAGYFFEMSFSTLGYENVVVSASVGDDYNTYSVVNLQYSVDGSNFETVGSYTLPSRSWTTDDIALPAAANNQAKVYVRFTPDKSSAMVGATGDNDGLSLAELFVLADNVAAADEVAPTLVAALPADGATGASANGQIVLTFDEKVVAGSGEATLVSADGENCDVTATFSGKSAVFRYSALKYATSYKFDLPAGAVVDRNGNAAAAVSLRFTTMERQKPEARLYDAVVAADGSGDYTSLQEAIDAAPAGCVAPYLIFVKAGLYNEHIDIPATKPYLHIIGQGRDLVSIEDDKLCGGTNALDVSVGATVVDHAKNGYFEGVSFVNSYGRDNNDGPQALALYTMEDRVILNRCGLISYQDTYLTSKTVNRRHYVKDCWIEGAVDFIYGQGNVFFDACTLNIVRKSGGYIVAPNHAAGTTWGYVFMNTVITAPGVASETDVWLGRPWHENPITVFINTRAEVTIPAAGWFDHMGGLPTLWADYNTVDANGKPLDLSNRTHTYYYTDDDGNKVYGEAKNFLTDEEAAAYTLKNVLSGDDAWQPDVICEQCEAPDVTIADGLLSWPAVDYAICYVVEKDGVVETFTTDTSVPYTEGASYRIFAANEYGGLSDPWQLVSTSAVAGVEGAEPSVMAVYATDGRLLSAPRHGVNVVVYSDGSSRKVVVK